MKKISEFLSENFPFLVVKFSIYLNRHVFVMYSLAVPSEKILSMHKTNRFRFIQFYLGLFSLLTNSIPMILLADSKGPDQTAQMGSLVWAFYVCICQKTHFRMAQPI